MMSHDFTLADPSLCCVEPIGTNSWWSGESIGSLDPYAVEPASAGFEPWTRATGSVVGFILSNRLAAAPWDMEFC